MPSHESPVALSNGPFTTTGYGTQSALFGPRINKRGYDVAFSAFYGLKGSRLGWVAPDGQEMIIYPGGDSPYGNDVVGAHAQHWFQGSPGFIFLLTDPWVIDTEVPKEIPTVAWVPVDHDPLIPLTHDWFKDGGAYPLAMSKFGQRVLEAQGHETEYAPHGFDADTFKPMDRTEARLSLGIDPEAFVIGMVAANYGRPSRKAFGEALMAFSVFQRNHPDALLYLFTKLTNPHGEDIPAQLTSLGIRFQTFSQYGLMLGTPNAVVAQVMNSFDVLLNPSRGEGFGCTLVEAQACGTPCITTDWSSMPEVAPVDVGNWTVGGQEYWNPEFLSIQKTPSIAELIACMEEAYAESGKAREQRRNSVQNWAFMEYEADHVTDTYLIPALNRIKEKIRDRQPDGVQPA